MTVREMKAINKQISRLKSKLERLRAEAVNISPKLSAVPPSRSVSDKISANISEIADTEQQLNQAKALREYHLNRLSVENETENYIWLHLARGFSWQKIANLTDGRPDTADSIRMRCRRYFW